MATIVQPVDERVFEHLVLDFLAYLEFERGLSRNTLEAYRSDLLQYGRFLDEREIQAVAAQSADIADFLAALAGSGGRSASPATIRSARRLAGRRPDRPTRIAMGPLEAASG